MSVYEPSSPLNQRRIRHSSENVPSQQISRKPSIAIDRSQSIAFDRSHSSINEAYLQFVSTLLKECKTKVSILTVLSNGACIFSTCRDRRLRTNEALVQPCGYEVDGWGKWVELVGKAGE